MGHIGWAEHALAQHLAQEQRDEAAALAAEEAAEMAVADAMDDIACSDLSEEVQPSGYKQVIRGGQPVDDIAEWVFMGEDTHDEAVYHYVREAMRDAAIGFSRRHSSDNGREHYAAAGQALAKALELACYARHEEKAK